MTITQMGNPKIAQPNHILPEEIVHVVKRKHWFVLVSPMLTLLGFAALSTSLILFLTLQFRINQGAILLTIFLITILSLGISAKIIIDWIFNYYVVTSHKISETRINPLFGDSISEILLKQVRCTEVDVINYGIVNQLLNKGSVYITFDRPTHKEEFVLSEISNPREIGTFLSDILIQPQSSMPGLWTKEKGENGTTSYRYSEELLPLYGVGGDI